MIVVPLIAVPFILLVGLVIMGIAKANNHKSLSDRDKRRDELNAPQAQQQSDPGDF